MSFPLSQVNFGCITHKLIPDSKRKEEEQKMWREVLKRKSRERQEYKMWRGGCVEVG
jgi:hypothetical protein